MTRTLNTYRDECHEAAVDAGWWNTDKTEQNLTCEKLLLIVSEVTEAMEGARKDLNDDHLPHRKMEEVELADALIRIFDYAGHKGYDLEGAVLEKMEYNAQRADHKAENRQAEGGKKW